MSQENTTAMLTREYQIVEAPSEATTGYIWARCAHECGIETDGHEYESDAEAEFSYLAADCRKCAIDPAALLGSPPPSNLWPEELACLLHFHKDRERQDRVSGCVAAGNMEAARADQIREVMNAKRS